MGNGPLPPGGTNRGVVLWPLAPLRCLQVPPEGQSSLDKSPAETSDSASQEPDLRDTPPPRHGRPPEVTPVGGFLCFLFQKAAKCMRIRSRSPRQSSGDSLLSLVFAVCPVRPAGAGGCWGYSHSQCKLGKLMFRLTSILPPLSLSGSST